MKWSSVWLKARQIHYMLASRTSLSNRILYAKKNLEIMQSYAIDLTATEEVLSSFRCDHDMHINKEISLTLRQQNHFHYNAIQLTFQIASNLAKVSNDINKESALILHQNNKNDVSFISGVYTCNHREYKP
uniref:Uncharacterized protein n=1 Tax=Rhizophora mucronata TaxID=61149 RepID=A0A2P2QRY5_RHIMU